MVDGEGGARVVAREQIAHVVRDSRQALHGRIRFDRGTQLVAGQNGVQPRSWVKGLTGDMGNRSSCRRGGPCRCPGGRPAPWGREIGSCWRWRPAGSPWRRSAGSSGSAGVTVQVARAVARRGRRRAGRSVSGAAQSSAGGGGGARRGLSRGAPRASDLGSVEGAGVAGPAKAVAALAGGEHDRRALRPRGADGQAPAQAAGAA